MVAHTKLENIVRLGWWSCRHSKEEEGLRVAGPNGIPGQLAWYTISTTGRICCYCSRFPYNRNLEDSYEKVSWMISDQNEISWADLIIKPST
jgi:hypothetical protein